MAQQCLEFMENEARTKSCWRWNTAPNFHLKTNSPIKLHVRDNFLNHLHFPFTTELKYNKHNTSTGCDNILSIILSTKSIGSPLLALKLLSKLIAPKLPRVEVPCFSSDRISKMCSTWVTVESNVKSKKRLFSWFERNIRFPFSIHYTHIPNEKLGRVVISTWPIGSYSSSVDVSKV